MATTIDSRIRSDFEGWTGETIFELDNGQFWQQHTYAYAYHYASRPAVHLEREGTLYRMTVEGMDGSILVHPLTVVADTTIAGDFEGWEGETIFELANGQVWQQAAYAYTYHYAYRPDVLVYCSPGHFEMLVDGVDASVQVKRIK